MSDTERFAHGGLIESSGTVDVAFPWFGGCLISAAQARRLANRPEIRAALDRLRCQTDNETDSGTS